MLWPIVISFLAGLICQPYVESYISITVAGILVIFLFGGVVFCLHTDEFFYAKVFLSISFMFVGFLLMSFALAVSPTDISHYSGEQSIKGEVANVPKVTASMNGKIHVTYVIAARKIQVHGEWHQVSGKFMAVLSQQQSDRAFSLGDRVMLTGKLYLPHNYQNPAMFDQVMSLKERGISATLWIKSMRGEQRFHGFSLANVLADMRAQVHQRMAEAMAPGDAALLSGMLFGGYDGIRSDIIHDFAATGIIHILSVSGTHIALVAGAAAAICSLFHASSNVTAAVCAMFMISYSMLSGLVPAVVRSLMMGLAALLAVWSGRSWNSSQALLMTVLLLLFYQPLWIYDLSFLLSFAATGGIVWFFPSLRNKLDFVPTPLALSLAVTLAAELGVLPFVAYYFNNLPLSSILANLAIVPIIELTVLVALSGAVCTWILPVFYLLNRFIFAFCSLIVGFAVLLTQGLAYWGGLLYVPAFNWLTGLIYYIGLFYLFGYHPKFIWSAREVWRRYSWSVALLCSLMLLMGSCYAFWPKPVTVHFIDVGQGDATLVITPHRHAVLIDTGGTLGEDSVFDVGERVVVPYLKHYGVTQVDVLILTHGHQDHAGGAAAVAELLCVKQVVIAKEAPSPAMLALEKAMHHEHLIFAAEGQKLDLDGVHFEVIHAENAIREKPGNEVSSVIRFNYGANSFLITGDLEADGEQEILEKGITPVNVLKVGHHGSKNASTADFLAVLHPEYAIISVGYDNHFGHPHAETLRRLQAIHAKIYRTDENGAVVFTLDGRNISVRTFVGGMSH
ncbi:DNA internalization-related competence protein ComEC/Rec2 [Pelorhabdus rhamnosifermentans]|uniref:DNA internalization-related competence protein ComEC/Rec2 n=1 Tax=Pelorhabdus rhamnosifermentans TaxID=2772457 RepID=UPI001C05EFE4|nr:DNA internalization-related competence protein ComEC/Rec2 [Pelorhabdus rhamnosifermentans]